MHACHILCEGLTQLTVVQVELQCVAKAKNYFKGCSDSEYSACVYSKWYKLLWRKISQFCEQYHQKRVEKTKKVIRFIYIVSFYYYIFVFKIAVFFTVFLKFILMKLH